MSLYGPNQQKLLFQLLPIVDYCNISLIYISLIYILLEQVEQLCSAKEQEIRTEMEELQVMNSVL